MKPIDYFYEISKIPRGSGNEKAVARYIEAIAKRQGLFCVRDALHNVYVRKPASVGCELKKPLLFAAHTDMVCEKLPSSTHDFFKDGIEIIEENGILRANGTTLGADDGAGVALMLALMTEELSSAPMTEYLFTTSEETGMFGAAGFDYTHICAETVISLDGGYEGAVCVGCASGYHYDLNIPLLRSSGIKNAFCLSVAGLSGGHSGNEIDTGKQNAVAILGTLLAELYEAVPFSLIDVCCDGKDNVIPPNADATLSFDSADDANAAKAIMASFAKAQSSLLTPEDARNFNITCHASSTATDPLTKESTEKILAALALLPYGVRNRFSSERSPEASVNFGIVKTEKNAMVLSGLARAGTAFSDQKYHTELKQLAKMLGGTLTLNSTSPAWERRENSHLQQSYAAACKAVLGISPAFGATHAGLECGHFFKALTDLGKVPDIITIGPNMQGIHSPAEALEKASLDRIYRVLKELLTMA